MLTFQPHEVAVATTIAYRPRADVGKRAIAQRGRFAFQAMYRSYYSGEDATRYVHGAMALAASLEDAGSRVDRIAITAYLSPTHQARLTDGGWCVLDAGKRRVGKNASLGIDMQRFYRPVSSAEQAQAERRPWTQRTQDRRDGAATYYKFLAWALTRYKRLLHVDCDTILSEAPDRYLTHQPPYFMATPATDERAYRGFISHLMLLTPDAGIFEQILAKAASGQYLAYTNTDQDVLETMFTASAAGAELMPRHQHHPSNVSTAWRWKWARRASGGGPRGRASAYHCPRESLETSLQRTIHAANSHAHGRGSRV